MSLQPPGGDLQVRSAPSVAPHEELQQQAGSMRRSSEPTHQLQRSASPFFNPADPWMPLSQQGFRQTPSFRQASPPAQVDPSRLSSSSFHHLCLLGSWPNALLEHHHRINAAASGTSAFVAYGKTVL